MPRMSREDFDSDPTVDASLLRPMDRQTFTIPAGHEAVRDADGRATGETLPAGKSEAQQRKNKPITTGVLDYFPDALLAVAEVSRVGNEQHNPGEPLHWAKGKSIDHADSLVRHLLDRGKFDTDGQRHSTKVAWRALALLQTEIEAEKDGSPAFLNGADHKWDHWMEELEQEAAKQVPIDPYYDHVDSKETGFPIGYELTTVSGNPPSAAGSWERVAPDHLTHGFTWRRVF